MVEIEVKRVKADFRPSLKGSVSVLCMPVVVLRGLDAVGVSDRLENCAVE